jgi:hypothetical protein
VPDKICINGEIKNRSPAAPPAIGVAGECDPTKNPFTYSSTKGGWGYVECNANHTMKACYICNAATRQYEEKWRGLIGSCQVLCGAESFCDDLKPGELREGKTCDANCQVPAAAAAGGTSGMTGTVELAEGET